jgi:hypothetical protein
MRTVLLHIREQAKTHVIITSELRDIDGKPPGVTLPEHGFPHVQDVVNDAARESASDFNAKFICVVAKFDGYHSVVQLGESFRSTSISIQQFARKETLFLY